MDWEGGRGGGGRERIRKKNAWRGFAQDGEVSWSRYCLLLLFSWEYIQYLYKYLQSTIRTPLFNLFFLFFFFLPHNFFLITTETHTPEPSISLFLAEGSTAKYDWTNTYILSFNPPSHPGGAITAHRKWKGAGGERGSEKHNGGNLLYE